MTIMATWIRRIVSGKKKRFQDGPHGFDLDLAYISPRIIAMGLPAEGKDVLYRNPLPEIARFLQTYHRGRAKVYNLCSEHKYSPDKLSVQLQHYPFDDHQTPALLVVQAFCADAAAWLAAHPHNVVVVHCKAGKGRTGIMTCCLMLYLHFNAPALANLPGTEADSTSSDPPDATVPAVAAGESGAGSGAAAARDAPAGAVPVLLRLSRSFSAPGGPDSSSSRRSGDTAGHAAALGLGRSSLSSPCWHPWASVEPVQLQQLEQPVQDVLDLYAARRTHDGNGVTIPSQRRYVGYFWSVLARGPKPCGSLPKPRTLQLREVAVSGLPPGTADSCAVVVEARPSGSIAASASRVLLSPARRASTSSMPGLCLVPCSLPPQVQHDGSHITSSSSPAGDSLSLKLPAASMGLSIMCCDSCTSSSSACARKAAGDVPAAAAGAAGGGATAAAAGDASVGGCIPGCGVACCSCIEAGGAAVKVHPAVTAAPAAGWPAGGGTAAGAAAASVCDGGCSTSGLTVEEMSEVGERDSCCVVEGDVRIVVLRGGVRLFYTWFNTAFVPAGGCFKLSRCQLDKTSKALPAELSLTVRYVDMQPRASSPEGEQAVEEDELTHAQEDWGLQGSSAGFAGLNSPAGAGGGKQQGSAAASVSQQQQGLGYRAQAPAVLKLTGSKSSDALESTAAATAAGSSIPGQQQRQQQRNGSVSAPASPQGGSSSSRLARASSWRQHLPYISSLSHTGMFRGSSLPEDDAGAEQHGCAAGQGSSTAAAGAAEGWDGAACTAAAPSSRRQQGETAAPHFWDWDWSSLAAATAAAAAEEAAAAGRASSQQQQEQEQQEQQVLAPSASQGAAGRQQGSTHNRQQQHFMKQDLHASRSSDAVAASSIGTTQNAPAAPAAPRLLGHSPGGIELPVFRRPAVAGGSAVASTLQVLLDPAVPGVPHSNPFDRCNQALNTGQRLSGSLTSHGTVKATGAPAAAPPGRFSNRSSGGSSGRSSSRRSFNNMWQLLQQQQQQSVQDTWQQRDRQTSSVTAAATAPGPKALGAAAQQRQQVADADDATDGGDVYVTDLVVAGDAFSPLLRAAAPSAAVPGTVLGSDPLQGLLEALNWSTDGWRHQVATPHTLSSSGGGSGDSSSSSKYQQHRQQQQQQQRQRRHTFSGGRVSSSSVGSAHSASSSRGSSPVLHDALSKAPSAPDTPPQQYSAGRAPQYLSTPCGGPGLNGDAASKPQSPVSLLDLDEEVCCGAVVGGQGLAVTSAAAAAAAGAAGSEAADGQGSEGDGVWPAAAAGQAPAEPEGVVRLTHATGQGAATAAPAAAAAGNAACCLDCVFGDHVGPCPVAAAAGDLASGARGAQGTTPSSVGAQHRASRVLLPAARQALQPENSSVGAGWSTSSSSAKRTVGSAAGNTATAAAGGSSGFVRPVPTSCPTAAAGIDSTVGAAALQSTAAPGGSVISIARRSTTGDIHTSTATNASLSAAAAGLGPSSVASRANSVPVDAVGREEDLLQGLLQAAAGDGRSCSSAAASCCGSESVANLVQRWEQLEKAWQRSWWV